MTAFDAFAPAPRPARARERSWPAGERAGVMALAFAGLALLAAIFVRMMNFDLRRDEQLYAPPAVLLDDLSLYQDFFYNHVPGSAWLFHAVWEVSGADHLLFAARLGVFLCWTLLAFGGAFVLWRLSRSLWLTAASSLLLLASELLLGQTGMAATNNLPPLALAFVGLGLFMSAIRRAPAEPAAIFAAGLLLALAAAMKASAVAFIPPAAAAALLFPQDLALRERLLRCVAPLAAGGLLGAAPVLVVFAADPHLFLAHVAGFHTGPHVAYWAAHDGLEGDVALSLLERLRLFITIVSSGTSAIALFVVFLLLVLIASGRGLGGLARAASGGPVAVAAAALVTTTALSFAPTPAFPQYFAPPLVCLPLLAAALFDELDRSLRSAARPALMAAVATLLALSAPRLAQDLPLFARPDAWTVSRIHEAGVAMAREMEARGATGKVATVAPIYALEGGLAVYPEFATGPFAYRIAEFAEPDLLAAYRTTSPDAIAAMLEADPPAAFLLGFEPEIEAEMARFAQANGYEPVEGFSIEDRYGTARLYLRRP